MTISTHNKDGDEYCFDSFSEFHECIRDRACPHYVFRGVQSYDFELIPRVGRKLQTPTSADEEQDFYAQERTQFEIFKSRAISQIGSPAFSDWDWLTLAQHYGVSTRFLDWSENPLVGLYFSTLHSVDDKGVPRNLGEDGALYFMHPETFYTTDSSSPFDNTHSGLFYTPHHTQRLVAQSALFSIHSRPWIAFSTESENIVKFRITAKFKAEIAKILPRYGFTRRTMYADFDSLSADLDRYMDSHTCMGGKKIRIQIKK